MNTPAGSATGIDLATLTRYTTNPFDKPREYGDMVERPDGEYVLLADVEALARATPQHSVTEHASIDTPEFRRLFGKYDSARGVANINHAYRDLIAYIDSRAQPLASTSEDRTDKLLAGLPLNCTVLLGANLGSLGVPYAAEQVRQRMREAYEGSEAGRASSAPPLSSTAAQPEQASATYQVSVDFNLGIWKDVTAAEYAATSRNKRVIGAAVVPRMTAELVDCGTCGCQVTVPVDYYDAALAIPASSPPEQASELSIADRIRAVQADMAGEASLQIFCALDDELNEARAALAIPASTAAEQTVAWMKPDEIEGLIKAASEGVATRHYGRVYARQYDADMVAVGALATPASTAANCGNSHQSPYETAGQPALGIGDVIVTAASEQQADHLNRAAQRVAIAANGYPLRPDDFDDVAASEQQAGADERALYEAWIATGPADEWTTFNIWRGGYRAALPHRATTAEDLTNHLVSVDVSTGDDDASHRIFAELTGETGSDGRTLLAIETSRNFAAAAPEIATTAADQQGDTASASDAAPDTVTVKIANSKTGESVDWDVPRAAVEAAQQGAAQAQAGDVDMIRTIVTKACEFYLGHLSSRLTGADFDAARSIDTTNTACRAIAYDLAAMAAPATSTGGES